MPSTQLLDACRVRQTVPRERHRLLDNRGTMHYALTYYDFSVRRHMRTTIADNAPY